MDEYTREDRIQLLKSLAFYLSGDDDVWGGQQISYLDVLIDILTGNETIPNMEKEEESFYRRMCHCLLDAEKE